MSVGTTISHLLHPNDPVPKVKTVFHGISDRDPAKAVKYLNPNKFINHNVRALEGVAGFEGFIGHLPPEKSPIEILRILQDGDYVVTHSTGDIMGAKVLFDIFRFEDGQIVEHWDNFTEPTPANESGHTAIDGTTEIEDRDKTESNKAIVCSFYEAIFLQGRFDQMPNFFDGDKYIRHDARGGDNLSSLNKLMQEQAKQGATMSVSKAPQDGRNARLP